MSTPGTAPSYTLNAAQQKMRKQMSNPFLFRFFLLWKLPLGWFAGLKLKKLSPEECVATIPYGWRSQNPFQSIYFAAQSMAAELSTGALVMFGIAGKKPAFAMLVVGMEAEFTKKADQLTTFTCHDGPKLFEAIKRAEETGEAQQIKMETIGTMPDGTEVARFYFTWSIKQRSK
ncbi:MAG: DUF4442 domain-containing protein [Chitinophagales bacterium]